MKVQFRCGGEVRTIVVTDADREVIGGGKMADRKAVVDCIERGYVLLLASNAKDYRANRAKQLREEAEAKLKEAEALDALDS